VAGCAVATNYLEPATPSYEYRFGEPDEPPSPATHLRVVSFNIAFAREVGRALDLLQGEPALRSPDLLFLQEMDAPAVERVARALGMNAVYMPSGVHPSSGRDFGPAILSPWPLVDPHKLIQPHAARVSHFRRVAVRATLVRGGLRVRAYSVHLTSPLAISGGGRRDQLQVVLDDAAGSTDPVVIAGDFNSSHIGNELVEAGYTWVTREVGGTTKFLFFELAFDHVFTRGLVADATIPPGRVKDNRGSSDHLPVYAVLVPSAADTTVTRAR